MPNGRLSIVLIVPVLYTLVLLLSFDDLPGPRWSSSRRQQRDGRTPDEPAVRDVHEAPRQLLQQEEREELAEELDARLLRDMLGGDAIKEDGVLPKEQKLWFMLKRRGWQSEVEIKRALDLLKRTDEMLSGAGRDYFLFHGSLLGYCRHAGFIPWDDDMDIATSRANIHWLLSPVGQVAVAAQGLKLKSLGSGYHKVRHAR